MSFQDEMNMVADELRGIANEGARYADNDYDRKRYGRLLSSVLDWFHPLRRGRKTK